MAIDHDLHVNKGINLIDPVRNIIEKFKEHPSIVSINQKMFMPNSFSFKSVSENDIICVINNIDSSKAYQKDNIPPSRYNCESSTQRYEFEYRKWELSS